MDKESLIKEFIEAIEIEIKTIRKKNKGPINYKIFDGEMTQVSRNKFVYTFTSEEPIEIEEDTPIQIKVGDKKIDGNIMAISGLKILISIEENIGHSVKQAILIADPTFLLRKLIERLKTNHNLPANLAMKVFGLLRVK